MQAIRFGGAKLRESSALLWKAMTFREKLSCRFVPPVAAGLDQVQEIFILLHQTQPHGLMEKDLEAVLPAMILFHGLMDLI